jgi:hypothetical protein
VPIHGETTVNVPRSKDPTPSWIRPPTVVFGAVNAKFKLYCPEELAEVTGVNGALVRLQMAVKSFLSAPVTFKTVRLFVAMLLSVTDCGVTFEFALENSSFPIRRTSYVKSYPPLAASAFGLPTIVTTTSAFAGPPENATNSSAFRTNPAALRVLVFIKIWTL